MKYCSQCGSNKITLRIPEGDNMKRNVCADCDTIFYTNPKIVVGCLALFEGKILMGRRAIEPRFGLWNLPAGYLENGETTQEGAIREVREETEAEVEIIKLHCIYNLPHANQVYIHFLANMLNGHFAVTPESSEVKLFAPDEIPWDEIAFTSSTFALKKFIKYGPEGNGSAHLGTLDLEMLRARGYLK